MKKIIRRSPENSPLIKGDRGGCFFSTANTTPCTPPTGQAGPFSKGESNHKYQELCWSMVFILISLSLFSCSAKKAEPPKKPAVPVTVGSAITKDVPVQLKAIGNVEPYSSINIKARIGGELTQVNFIEGQDVNMGQLLFNIDCRTYKTALESAEANLMRDKALEKKALEDLRRYTELLKDELVSRSQYDLVFANAEAAKAVVSADKSAVENARIQIGYCSIHSPISGRTGSLLVNQGNLIKADDANPLVVINRIQPVYVSFTLPEHNLPQIKKYMSAGRLKVMAFISTEESKPEEGVLTFLDNTVDTATGTIKLKATFSNKDKRLWPGQFVNVVINLAVQADAVVVPSQAVQTGQQGQFVFVVKDDIAEFRPVIAGVTYEDMTVIEKGLSSGEQVVTDGQMRVIPGGRVEIKNQQGTESIEQKAEGKERTDKITEQKQKSSGTANSKSK
jgi:membrane fusion protein, multidrug efflux system